MAIPTSPYGQRRAFAFIFWFYSINAPNERVPVHWENRYLLPFSDLDIEERNSYSAQGRKIHAATDSQAVRPRLECG